MAIYKRKPTIIWSQEDLKADREKRALHTYLFRYYDPKAFAPYLPYYNWFDAEGGDDSVPHRDKDFLDVQLYTDKQPYTDARSRKVYFQQLLSDHFSAAFGTATITGKDWVFLPKRIYKEFRNLIEQFGLNEFADILLESICIAQEVLSNEIHYWEKSESQKIKKTARTDFETLIKVIEKIEQYNMPGKIGQSPAPKLTGISFQFEDQTYKIGNDFLLSEIGDILKPIAESWSPENWRNAAKAYAKSFDAYPFKNQFRQDLAYSFYTFLVERKLFQISNDTPTPNNLMLCIAKLLELSLVPTTEPNEPDSLKIRTVRNWIRRRK